MNFIFVPYLWVHSSLLVLYVILFIYAWEIRSSPGAKYFLGTLFAGAFWSLTQGMEIAAVHLDTKLIWANLQYTPQMFIASLFYLYAITFTKRHWKKVSLASYAVLFLLPTIFTILIWSFPGLVRQNVSLEMGGNFSVVKKDYGPLFWLMAIYNYTVIFMAAFGLLNALKEKTETVKKQVIIVFIAVFFPIVTNLMWLAGLRPFAVDLSPLAYAATAIIITLGIVRYNLFKVIPIARSIVIREMKVGMIVFDSSGALLDINPAALRLLKLKDTPVIGTKIGEAFKDAHELIRIFNTKKNMTREISFQSGEVNYYYEVTLNVIKDSGESDIGWLIQLYDITERKLAEEIIEQAALHDSLTGLPNRQYFQMLFSQELAVTRMRNGSLAVAFIDIDNFKQINDTYGHEVGDLVLKNVTRRFKTSLRDSDIIARAGGDEFIAVFPNLGNESEISALGERIVGLFEEDVEVMDYKISVHSSIGFSVFPKNGDNMEILLRKADKAMYFAKEKGKNKFKIYNDSEL